MRTRTNTRGPWTLDALAEAVRLARGISALLPDGWACRVFEVSPAAGPARYRVEVEGPGGSAGPGAEVARVVARFEGGEQVG